MEYFFISCDVLFWNMLPVWKLGKRDERNDDGKKEMDAVKSKNQCNMDEIR